MTGTKPVEPVLFFFPTILNFDSYEQERAVSTTVNKENRAHSLKESNYHSSI